MGRAGRGGPAAGKRQATLRRGAASLTSTVCPGRFRPRDGQAGEDA
ncbi:DUF6380 family protein [Streptomyces sp. NPDC007851]